MPQVTIEGLLTRDCSHFPGFGRVETSPSVKRTIAVEAFCTQTTKHTQILNCSMVAFLYSKDIPLRFAHSGDRCSELTQEEVQ